MLETPYRAFDDTHVIPSYAPVPGLGLLPINSFVIKAREPVLFDTCAPIDRDAFLDTLRSVIDPVELKWIVLSHADRDHSGNVEEVLEAAPNARLVANWATIGKLTGEFDVPMERVFRVNLGQSFSAGDRDLAIVSTPIFDSAGTIGMYDATNGALFSVDAFGSFIPSHVDNAGDVPQAEFAEKFNIWNQANHPWVTMADQHKFDEALKEVWDLKPTSILSSHLPPAHGRTDDLMKALSKVPALEPFIGPDQATVDAMMAQMGGPPH
ncbi:MAG: MBL fold metallo-hydrolase [Dehalococcoidia bacterium]